MNNIFKPEELDERSEWLFWSCLFNTEDKLASLKETFKIDDEKWILLKEDAFFEILLRDFAWAVSGLQEKILAKDQIDNLVRRLRFFLEIKFSNYKDYQILHSFSGYLAATNVFKDFDKLKKEIEDICISRLCKLFALDWSKINKVEIRDLIFMNFPFGVPLALDAFTNVAIKQIKSANLMARKMFRSKIIEWDKKIRAGETEEEIKERKKHEKSRKEFSKVANEFADSVDGIEKEIKRRLLRVINEFGNRLDNDPDRLDKEMIRREQGVKDFLLNLDRNKSLEDQITKWIKKEKFFFSEQEIEDFLEKVINNK